MTFEAVHEAVLIAERKNLRIRVISRSDSTLRGHFAAEIAAAHSALRASGVQSQGTVFVPAFLEAGRVTVHDVQWVESPGGYVPAARTEFARDATFGYAEEDLLSWVEERVGWAGVSTSVSIDELRADDSVARVARRIGALGRDQIMVVNAAAARDLEVLMLSLLEQERNGQRPLIRSGPSFVRLAAGQGPAAPLAASQVGARSVSGLIVVGSHTALTTAQVQVATAAHRLTGVELKAAAIVGNDKRSNIREVDRCAREVLASLEAADVALCTSREVLTGEGNTPLLTSRAVADALVEVVARVVAKRELGFLVAKGGVTSSDMAARALAVRRARVAGQMLPGIIPVWQLLDGTCPGLTYVVFPGNVGDVGALTAVLAKLRDADG